MTALHTVPLFVVVPIGFAAGILLGFGFFGALRVTADLIVSGGPALRGLVLTIGRIAILGGALYLAVLAGAPALLALLAGLLCAKHLMLRSMRKVVR